MRFQDAAIKRTSTRTASDNHANASHAESLKAHFTADSLNFKQPKKNKKNGQAEEPPTAKRLKLKVPFEKQLQFQGRWGLFGVDNGLFPTSQSALELF